MLDIKNGAEYDGSRYDSFVKGVFSGEKSVTLRSGSFSRLDVGAGFVLDNAELQNMLRNKSGPIIVVSNQDGVQRAFVIRVDHMKNAGAYINVQDFDTKKNSYGFIGARQTLSHVWREGDLITHIQYVYIPENSVDTQESRMKIIIEQMPVKNQLLQTKNGDDRKNNFREYIILPSESRKKLFESLFEGKTFIEYMDNLFTERECVLVQNASFDISVTSERIFIATKTRTRFGEQRQVIVVSQIGKDGTRHAEKWLIDGGNIQTVPLSESIYGVKIMETYEGANSTRIYLYSTTGRSLFFNVYDASVYAEQEKEDLTD